MPVDLVFLMFCTPVFLYVWEILTRGSSGESPPPAPRLAIKSVDAARPSGWAAGAGAGWFQLVIVARSNREGVKQHTRTSLRSPCPMEELRTVLLLRLPVPCPDGSALRSRGSTGAILSEGHVLGLDGRAIVCASPSCRMVRRPPFCARL